MLPPGRAQDGRGQQQQQQQEGRGFAQLMAGQWRCMLDDLVSGRSLARLLAPTNASAPPCYPDVTVHLYTPGSPPRRKVLDPRRAGWLRWSGWDPGRRTVLLVHGFNGGADRAPTPTLRDAYLEAGAYNVLVLDWSPLARYPCYADAVRHSRTAARCGARVVRALQQATALELNMVGVGADPRLATTCVGHSLGAHICGMLSRMLPQRLRKVVALDPARPQVERLLGADALAARDARVVQSFHTNMGFYGEYPAAAPADGHASFCFNGGRLQPSCDQGGRFSRMRCSHFLSVCYYAQLVRSPGGWTAAVPCDSSCNRERGRPPFALTLTEASMDRRSLQYAMAHHANMIAQDTTSARPSPVCDVGLAGRGGDIRTPNIGVFERQDLAFSEDANILASKDANQFTVKSLQKLYAVYAEVKLKALRSHGKPGSNGKVREKNSSHGSHGKVWEIKRRVMK
ncbi:hypothetical protein KUF71_002078, partial [Frankliniella fusca]